MKRESRSAAGLCYCGCRRGTKIRRTGPRVAARERRIIKTWAGLFGGVATTVVLAALLGPWLTLMDLPRSLLAGLIIGVAGFFGDLSISAIKRDETWA